MGGRRTAAFLLAVLACAATLALPVGQAGGARLPVSGLLETTGPATFQGRNGLVASADGLLAESGGALRLDAPGAVATRVNVPRMVVLGPGGEPGVRPPVELAEEVLGEAPVDGLTFAADDEGQARVLGDGLPLGLRLAEAERFRVGPGPATPRGPAFHGVEQAQGRGLAVDPAGWLDGFALPGLSWEEPFAAFLMGGTVRPSAGGPAWATGHAVNQTRSHVDPATGAGVLVYDNVLVLVAGRGGAVSWPDGGAAWSLAVRSLSGPFEGDAAWTGVRADLEAGGRPVAVEPRLLHMRGDLHLDAEFQGAGRWTVAGTATFLAVDAGADWMAGAAAAAAGVGLLAALLALLTEPGRAALAFLLGRHGRLTKAAPLRSPSRRRVLEAIHVHQPVRATELRAVTGLSRTSLAYHLRVLLAYNVVQAAAGTAGGRNLAFVLNSGSLDFALDPPAADGEEARALHALAAANSHPARRSLYVAVRDHGPLDFAGINALRAAAGLEPLAQSSATHHLQGLVRAGALSVERQGKRKVYAAALHDGDARVEQYRRFLRQLSALDLVRALRAAPLRRDGAPPAQRRLLERLGELGLVAYDRADGAYRVAPLFAPVAERL